MNRRISRVLAKEYVLKKHHNFNASRFIVIFFSDVQKFLVESSVLGASDSYFVKNFLAYSEGIV